MRNIKTYKRWILWNFTITLTLRFDVRSWDCLLSFKKKKMKSFVVAIFIACFVVAFGEKVRFDNYRVYSVNVTNEKQLKALHELEESSDGTTFLESPTSVGQAAELLVPPHKFADIAELFDAYDIKNHIKTRNLQE